MRKWNERKIINLFIFSCLRGWELKKVTNYGFEIESMRINLWKMLNSASDALVKHINQVILSWNSYIQYIKNVKNCIYQH
jgi:hypothetical protein